MKARATPILAAVLLLAAPFSAVAQQITINGLADLGLSVPSQTTSWLKGGFGKLDNGGDAIKSIAPVGQVLSDIRLELDPALAAFATLRLAPDQHAPFDILEAYGRYRPLAQPDWLASIKFGEFFPPISLENESVGWTSPWTLTPSAINSWVGDELRTVGAEGTVEWQHEGPRVGLMGSVFWLNDPAGTLLANRGWVFDSRPIGLFGEPRVPDLFTPGRPLREQPFKEIDHRPGWYAGATMRQDGLGRLTALYYDNRADPGVFSGGDFAWRTKFASFGLETYIGDVVLLAQAMSGDTTIEPVKDLYFTTNFQSAYLLAGYYFGDFRVAGRFDLFATQKHSNLAGGGGPGEHGKALTVSGSWTPVRWIRFSTELIYVDSYNGTRIATGSNPKAREAQLQFVARFLF